MNPDKPPDPLYYFVAFYCLLWLICAGSATLAILIEHLGP
jgi:hypothetical protein